MVSSDICLLAGPGCCTTSLLDCPSSTEQSVDLDLGALTGGLCARMILPCIPSIDTSEERTDSAEQVGVGESVLVLDLYLVLETHLKPELQYSVSLQIISVKILDPLVVCLVPFKSFLLPGLYSQ